VKLRDVAVLLFLTLLASSPVLLLAQEDIGLSLTLSRDFGSGFGSRIRGTFSFRVTGPEEIESVTFLIDGMPIGEDSDAPFRMQFRTESYEPGIHSLSAIGYTQDGRELRSNEIRRDFLSNDQSFQMTALLVGSLLVLIVGGRLLASKIAGRGQGKAGRQAISGPFGGTVCPNCGRPYALHLWGINLVGGRLDKCPHCRKWRLVRRASQQDLETAAAKFEHPEDTARPGAHLDDEERLRRQIDQSRFEDSP